MYVCVFVSLSLSCAHLTWHTLSHPHAETPPPPQRKFLQNESASPESRAALPVVSAAPPPALERRREERVGYQGQWIGELAMRPDLQHQCEGSVGSAGVTVFRTCCLHEYQVDGSPCNTVSTVIRCYEISRVIYQKS